jgi:hypothetical protein
MSSSLDEQGTLPLLKSGVYRFRLVIRFIQEVRPSKGISEARLNSIQSGQEAGVERTALGRVYVKSSKWNKVVND